MHLNALLLLACSAEKFHSGESGLAVDTSPTDTAADSSDSDTNHSGDTNSGDTGPVDTGPLDCDNGAAATVEGTGFASVAQAVEVADGRTVAVCAGRWPVNLVITESVTIQGAGEAVTVLEGNGSASVFEVDAGTLALADVTVTGGEGVARDNYGGWGGGIAAFGADLIFERVTVRANAGDEGGGLALVEGRFEGRDIRFEENVTTMGGGGVTVAGFVGAELSCHTCTFAANETPGVGGGLNIYGSLATVTLDEGTIIRDHVVEGLGAGAFIGGGTLVLSDVVVSGNRVTGTTEGYGGAGLYVMGGSVLAYESVVTGNEAATRGGGVYLEGFTGECPSVSGLRVEANTAEEGGGVYLNACGTLTDLILSENTAASGGGLYAYPYLANAEVVGGAVTGNVASTGGGAFLTGRLTEVEAVDFAGNNPDDAATAAGSGYTWGGAVTTTCDGSGGCE